MNNIKLIPEHCVFPDGINCDAPEAGRRVEAAVLRSCAAMRGMIAPMPVNVNGETCLPYDFFNKNSGFYVDLKFSARHSNISFREDMQSRKPIHNLIILKLTVEHGYIVAAGGIYHSDMINRNLLDLVIEKNRRFCLLNAKHLKSKPMKRALYGLAFEDFNGAEMLRLDAMN